MDLVVDDTIKECMVTDFSRAEVLDALKLMKNNKSAGNSVCNIDVFKNDCPPTLIDCIIILFNACNTYGLPDSWKSALLLPLYKKGDKQHCCNYRGISLI